MDGWEYGNMEVMYLPTSGMEMEMEMGMGMKNEYIRPHECNHFHYH